MLFRIEDVSGADPNSRVYDRENFKYDSVEKAKIDEHIASKIREAVNGAKHRTLLSYSKSLATCILKYNKFTDNELHICLPHGMDYIAYIFPNGNEQRKGYSIQNRINGAPIFNENGMIQLQHFVIDVSDNAAVDSYLKHYTGTGKKVYASPEKDSEVVVMNPLSDLVISQYTDAVYILYALQLRYRFLCFPHIKSHLIYELREMDAFRFESASSEREAFIQLISYLSDPYYWKYETQISNRIYEDAQEWEHLSFYYDPLLQFHDILQDDLTDAYNKKTYNENVLSDLFWEYCMECCNYN